MKILLLGFAKIKYTPYANFYLDNIDTKKHSVTFLYWNRDCKDEELPRQDIEYLEFRCYQEDDVKKWSKISNFLKYRAFVKKHLKGNKYDLVIVLSTIPGILLSSELKKYKGKYIFDYRDETYERYAFYKRLVHKLVKNSRVTFVSSDGFRPLLPSTEQDKIYASHNILSDSLLHRDEKRRFGVDSNKIRIAFWGLIRPYSLNEALIKRIALDKRFELHYYGRIQNTGERLSAYAAFIGADNVFFHGEYKPEERYAFATVTDIMHNIYGSGGRRLMANKYYDGAIFRIPQLCQRGSYMSDVAERAGIGIGVDVNDDNLLDSIYEYFTQLDKDDFDSKCDAETERFVKEYRDGCDVIRSLLEE